MDAELAETISQNTAEGFLQKRVLQPGDYGVVLTMTHIFGVAGILVRPIHRASFMNTAFAEAPSQDAAGKYLYETQSRETIGAFLRVHWKPGYGFAESVYANALEVELRKRGIPYEREVPIVVIYEGIEVGHFRADFITHQRILLELKSVEQLRKEHATQTLNYLRSTDIRLALLLNFGRRPAVRRFINSHGARPHL